MSLCLRLRLLYCLCGKVWAAKETNNIDYYTFIYFYGNVSFTDICRWLKAPEFLQNSFGHFNENERPINKPKKYYSVKINC